MAGFFSVRLAPGVRVSASARGLRAHVGPRGMRLHAGGGGTGVSTGAGPFTYYHPVGSGKRRPASGSPRRGRASAAKAEHARQLADAFTQIEGLHRQMFPPVQPPVAPDPPVPSWEEVLAERRREHLRGTWFWQRTRRRQARGRAQHEAELRMAGLQAEASAAQRAEQARLDAQWERLLANDPEAVLAVLAESFEDNEAPVAPVGVAGDEASLVLLVPGVDAVPERYPTVTEAGNLSIRRLSATDRWATYRQLVAGHTLVSTREAFAVAPGLGCVALVVLRAEEPDVYGVPRAVPVLATRLRRQALEGVRWQEVSAWDVLEQAGEETLLETRGRAREIRPLDLSEQPELTRLVEAVDLTDLQ